MKNVFSKIELVLSGIPDGWCSVEKALTMASAVMTMRPQVVVEIGTYSGRSFIPMAMTLQEIGKGVAIGIDPYATEASLVDQDPVGFEWWSKLDHKRIESMFIQQINSLLLAPFVQIVKQCSDESVPPQNIGILHIDGNHGHQACRDVERFGSNVELGGYCFIDDVNTGCVNDAIIRLQKLGFVKLYHKDGTEELTGMPNNWDVLQRISLR